MNSKEAKTHIVDTINGDMYKEYFINELLPEILQDLDRLEELEKENQELQSKYDSLLRTFELQIEAKEKLLDERIKYIEAIHKAIELLSVDGKGTKQEVKKLLSEVLNNEI